MPKLLHPVFALVLLLGICPLTLGNPKSVLGEDRMGPLALDGYDPVAYFAQQRPVLGLDRYVTSWNRVTWKFSSAENRKMFQGDPQKYAPQYGGYCAFAVAHGSKAPGDPGQWHVHGGEAVFKLECGCQKAVAS